MYSGIVAIDKPADFTSFDVVAKLRGIFNTKKIGHTGTLDPMATGVLCVCVGKATKAVEFLSGHDKTYCATMLLGRSTDTGDITGETVKEVPLSIKEDTDGRSLLVKDDGAIIYDNDIQAVIKGFACTYEQLPPMYSAKKVGGKKLYELAREGKTAERKRVPVTIRDIEIADMALPYITFRARVSSGTYIRTLCEDMAAGLGLPGTMSSLRRTRLGDIDIDDCLTLERLQEIKAAGGLDGVLTPVDDMFLFDRITVPCELDVQLLNGTKLLASQVLKGKGPHGDENSRYLLYSSKAVFVGIYEIRDGYFKPVKMFL